MEVIDKEKFLKAIQELGYVSERIGRVLTDQYLLRQAVEAAADECTIEIHGLYSRSDEPGTCYCEGNQQPEKEEDIEGLSNRTAGHLNRIYVEIAALKIQMDNKCLRCGNNN